MTVTAVADSTVSPVGTTTDRIGSLDVLRGIALLGMFLVHFNYGTTGGGSSGALYQRTVDLLFEERFWTMFGILFGVGFAVQLRRAEARGAPFVPMYARRLLMLAAVGLFTHAVFGYHVLFEYAVWGFPLLILRRLSTRALILALVISAASWSLYEIARATYGVATIGETAYRAQLDAEDARYETFRRANLDAQHAANYSTVFKARLAHMAWFYAQPYSFLPVNTLTLFLIGVLGLRLGLFDHPANHQRLIVALMIFGVASWAAATWLLPRWTAMPDGSLVRIITIVRFRTGFGLVRGMWLTFAYMGVVLLLVARDSAWLRRLSMFGWTGRMALTNYVIQVAILDLVFSDYSLGVQLTPLAGLAAALALFGLDAVLSRWWLTRFRFGPLEWLWRSATYARRQPLLLAS